MTPFFLFPTSCTTATRDTQVSPLARLKCLRSWTQHLGPSSMPKRTRTHTRSGATRIPVFRL